jgi:hypothetical protein
MLLNTLHCSRDILYTTSITTQTYYETDLCKYHRSCYVIIGMIALGTLLDPSLCTNELGHERRPCKWIDVYSHQSAKDVFYKLARANQERCFTQDA